MAGDGCRCYRLDCHGSGCGVGQGDRATLPSRGRRGTDCQRLRRYRGAVLVDLPGLLPVVIRVAAAKRLNDTHGHSIRDQALVAVGGALRLARPPTSLIARFGGEEFVVADTYRSDDLLDIAEQLRMAIAAIDFPITASIGIATAPLAASFAPAERELIDDLVNLADTAMYAAKHAGGNQSRSAHIPHADLKGSPA